MEIINQFPFCFSMKSQHTSKPILDLEPNYIGSDGLWLSPVVQVAFPPTPTEKHSDPK